MSVIPLTVAVSLCLVFTFIVFFVRENSRRFSDAARDSLLPLASETPRVVTRHPVADAPAAPVATPPAPGA